MIGIIQGLLELVNDSVSTEVFFFFFFNQQFITRSTRADRASYTS